MAVTVLAGCGGEERAGPAGSATTPTSAAPTTTTEAPTTTTEAPGRLCIEPEHAARPVFFEASDGVALAGVVVGDGPVGVVLAHEGGGTVCTWLDVGLRLRGEGYRVLLFDSRGNGASAEPPLEAVNRRDLDVAAAAAVLRDEGADRIVLAGGSFGAVAAVVAGADLDPPPAGVVAVSGCACVDDLDWLAAARRLDVPLLAMAAAEDGDFAAEAEALYEAAATGDKALEVLPDSTAHGSELFEGPTAGDAYAVLLPFLARVTGS